jgi:hypothetical protein
MGLRVVQQISTDKLREGHYNIVIDTIPITYEVGLKIRKKMVKVGMDVDFFYSDFGRCGEYSFDIESLNISTAIAEALAAFAAAAVGAGALNGRLAASITAP